MDTFKAAPTMRVVPFVYRPEMSVYEILCKMTDALNETIRVVDTLDLEALDQDIAELAELLDQIGSTDYPETIASLRAAIAAVEAHISSAGWIQTSNIADGAVTLDKMSEGNRRNMWSYMSDFSGKNAVFFGDSYMAENIDNSEQAFLPNMICSLLNMTKYNFAVAGAGFGRPSNLISAQTENALNSMTVQERQDTALVVCMAGVNDLLNVDTQGITQGMIVDGMRQFLLFASANFYHARVVLVPFAWGFSKLTGPLNRLITNCLNSVNVSPHGHGCALLPYAWTWNLGVANRFRNEVHPNQSGYRVIANHILNALMGSDMNSFMVGNDVAIDSEAISTTSQQFRYLAQNGKVRMSGYIRPVQAYEGASNEITLLPAGGMPAICTPNGSIFAMPLTNTTTGAHAGYIIVLNDGRLRCRFVDVAANDVCVFNDEFTCEVGVNWSDYN